MKDLLDCCLYAFVDTAYLHGRAPEDVARQLCDGGVDLIQLRAKQSSLDEIRRMAELILPVTRNAGVGLVINDHLSLAQELLIRPIDTPPTPHQRAVFVALAGTGKP